MKNILGKVHSLSSGKVEMKKTKFRNVSDNGDLDWLFDQNVVPLRQSNSIDQFSKRHGLVHNGGFPKFEAPYCSLNMVSLVKP